MIKNIIFFLARLGFYINNTVLCRLRGWLALSSQLRRKKPVNMDFAEMQAGFSGEKSQSGAFKKALKHS